GEVMEANRKLNQLKVTKAANYAVYDRHLLPLQDEMLLNISAPAHTRIFNAANQRTIYGDVEISAVPVATLTGAGRRLFRANSPLTKAVAMTTAETTIADFIQEVNNGSVQITTPYQAPTGQIPYDIWQEHQLTPAFTQSLPQNAGFQFSSPGVIVSSPTPGPISQQVQTMVNSIIQLHHLIENLPPYEFFYKPALPITSTRNVILTRTEPTTNALEIANNFIKLHTVSGQSVQILSTNGIMAAPKIRIPMYEELAKLSPDWIMPGLNNIEMNSINLLNVNRKYL